MYVHSAKQLQTISRIHTNFLLQMKVIAVDKEGVKSEQEVLHIVYVVEQPDGSLKVAKLKEFVDTAKWVHFAEVMKKKMAAA